MVTLCSLAASFVPPSDPDRPARDGLFACALDAAVMLSAGVASRFRAPGASAVAAGALALGLSGAAFAESGVLQSAELQGPAGDAAWLASAGPVNAPWEMQQVEIDQLADGTLSLRYRAWEHSADGTDASVVFSMPLSTADGVAPARSGESVDVGTVFSATVLVDGVSTSVDSAPSSLSGIDRLTARVARIGAERAALTPRGRAASTSQSRDPDLSDF